MKKLSKTNLTLFFALILGLSINTTRAMEEPPRKKPCLKLDEVTLVSHDGTECTIPHEIALLSGTLKNMLKDIPTSDNDIVIQLPSIDSSTQKTIISILKRVQKVGPQEIDNDYTPYKVQPIVDDILKKTDFNSTLKIFLAANYLDIPHLINATAHALVYENYYDAQATVTQNQHNVPKNLYFWFKKHIALKNAGATKEWSVADAIEENPATKMVHNRAYDTDENTLDLKNKKITDLYGVQLLSKIIDKEKITSIDALDLDNNLLITIQPNLFLKYNNLLSLQLASNKIEEIRPCTFQGLDQLKYLDLSSNKIKKIQDDALHGLGQLEELYLTNNEIEVIEPNAFHKSNLIEHIDLSHNKIEVIEPETFEKCDWIMSLGLSHNKIKTIQPKTLLGIANVDLSNNPLSYEKKDKIEKAFEVKIKF